MSERSIAGLAALGGGGGPIPPLLHTVNCQLTLPSLQPRVLPPVPLRARSFELFYAAYPDLGLFGSEFPAPLATSEHPSRPTACHRSQL